MTQTATTEEPTGREKLEQQLKTIKEVAKTYPTHSISNIIQQIESRINEQIKPET